MPSTYLASEDKAITKTDKYKILKDLNFSASGVGRQRQY